MYFCYCIGFPGDHELIKENLSIIKAKYSSLFVFVQRKLQAKEKGIELRAFLLPQCPWAAFLPQSASVTEVFETIAKQNGVCDFQNYHLLERIVDEFNDNDKEMTKKMKKYKQDLSGFKAANILKVYIDEHEAELVYSHSGTHRSPSEQSPEYFTNLSMKLKAKVSEYTLKYLDKLWSSLQEHLLLPELSFLLDSVRKGCVHVTWIFPAELAPQSIRRVHHCVYFFQQQPILWVEIDNVCVYIGKSTDSEDQEDEEILIEKTVSID